MDSAKLAKLGRCCCRRRRRLDSSLETEPLTDHRWSFRRTSFSSSSADGSLHCGRNLFAIEAKRTFDLSILSFIQLQVVDSLSPRSLRRLSVYLFVCLPGCPSVRPFIHLSVHQVVILLASHDFVFFGPPLCYRRLALPVAGRCWLADHM